MAESYIPARDAEALAWMQTFAGGLSASPATYEMTAAQAATVQSLVDAFAAAQADAIDPNERTPVTIAIKDEARNSAAQLCRQFATLIKFNAGISNSVQLS